MEKWGREDKAPRASRPLDRASVGSLWRPWCREPAALTTGVETFRGEAGDPPPSLLPPHPSDSPLLSSCFSLGCFWNRCCSVAIDQVRMHPLLNSSPAPLPLHWSAGISRGSSLRRLWFSFRGGTSGIAASSAWTPMLSRRSRSPEGVLARATANHSWVQGRLRCLRTSSCLSGLASTAPADSWRLR